MDIFGGPSLPQNKANSTHDSKSRPLAYSCRPNKIQHFYGQHHIFEKYKFLNQDRVGSLILWGPPGTGKTTLAHILAGQSDRELYPFNAVLGGVNELRKIIDRALEVKEQMGLEPIIFIDEIHRFNKAQQDALLPYVESGDFTLFGATTENPRSSVNRALLSRLQIIELKKLDDDAIFKILKRAKEEREIPVGEENLKFLAERSNGDARKALNTLESLWKKSSNEEISTKEIKDLILENCRDYDRNQNRHYDVISAFIKSMRGSDPNAALLWLAVMLDGGEDPVFIARRLVIFSSEDVGNADPWALSIANNALFTVKNIGMPEARITLAQAVSYLASTIKSNASYLAIDAALEYVRENPTIEVPQHLKSRPDENHPIKYQYPHSYPGQFIKQDYSGIDLPKFYNPTENGREKLLKDRLNSLWN